MKPVLLTVGKLKIYSSGTFMALALIVGGLFYYFAARSRGVKTTQVFDTLLYVVVAGLIGSRLGYYLIYRDEFRHLGQFFLFWQGGFVALPGLILALALFIYLRRQQGEPIWKVLDILGLSFLLGMTIGHFGCYLASCTVGRPWTGFLAVEGLYPVDLFGAILMLLAFAILLVIWLSPRTREGIVFYLAIESYLLLELLLKTLQAQFGNSISKVESIVYLGLSVVAYLIFWWQFGPRWQAALSRLGKLRQPPTNL